MSFTAKLAQTLAFSTGIGSAEQIPAALAAIVAADQGIDPRFGRDVFKELASRLKARSDLDALATAQDWLRECPLTEQQLEALLAATPKRLPRPMDWTAELEGLVEMARYREPFIPISTGIGAALGEALDLPRGESIACLFPGSATIAWGLARTRPVTLHVARWDIAVVMALLGFADGRALQVSSLNPIEFLSPPDLDGTSRFDDRHVPRQGQYDHIVTVPPLGFRVRDGAGAGMLFEAWQAEQLEPRAGKSFSSLATDGLLFRETRAEIEFRSRLCEAGKLTVTSLPPGIFGRASGVQVNLLRVQHGQRPEGVSFVDGRTMERVSRSGREQEELVIRRLDTLKDAPRREVSAEELNETRFNLSPARYIVSDEIRRLDEALADRPTQRLGDIARIIRPRAPRPLRGEASDDVVTAREIAVSDLVEGRVSYPSREVAFSRKELGSINRAQVENGDIVISIKGNVGIVGLVDESADVDDMLGTPQIVSQSLAIIRPKIGPRYSTKVLAGILASPQVRAKLQALAGGTTVPTLPTSVLQELPIPLPVGEELFELEGELEDLDAMQKDIEKRVSNRRTLYDALWRKFWNVADEDEA